MANITIVAILMLVAITLSMPTRLFDVRMHNR